MAVSLPLPPCAHTHMCMRTLTSLHVGVRTHTEPAGILPAFSMKNLSRRIWQAQGPGGAWVVTREKEKKGWTAIVFVL